MLDLVRKETEKIKMGMDKIKNVKDMQKIVDVNLINKIEQYKKVTDRYDAEVQQKDIKGLADQKMFDHIMQKTFKSLMKD